MKNMYKSVKVLAGGIIAVVAIGCSNQSVDPLSVGGNTPNTKSMATEVISVETPVYGLGYGWSGGLIDLSAEQQAQINAIAEKYRPVAGYMRGFRNYTNDEWQTECLLTRDSLRNEIYSVLTIDQKAFLENIAAQLETGVIPDTMVSKRIAHLNTIFSLTAEQQGLGFTILKADMQKKLDSLRNSGDSNWYYAQHGIRGAHNLPIEFVNLLSAEQQQLLTQCGYYGMNYNRRGNTMRHGRNW
jgi:hypothetical protein